MYHSPDQDVFPVHAGALHVQVHICSTVHVVVCILSYLGVLFVFWEATSKENERFHCLLLHISCVECLAGVHSTQVVLQDVQGSVVLGQEEKVTVFTA